MHMGRTINSDNAKGSGHVPHFIFGKMPVNTKVGIITGSRIAVAPSFHLCYQNWMLKLACKS